MKNRLVLNGTALALLVLIGCAQESTLYRHVGDNGLVSSEREWSHYGGDAGGTRYSPLGQVNRNTVDDLELAWSWRPEELPGGGNKAGKFEATPLMIQDVVYLTTPFQTVVALKADSGEVLWQTRTRRVELVPILDEPGWVHRGVVAWRDSDTGGIYIFLNARERLWKLLANSGVPDASFGAAGAVSLTESLARDVKPSAFLSTSPPVVVGDLVVVGSSIQDHVMGLGVPPGTVQAFDARTGRTVWKFEPRMHSVSTWMGAKIEPAGHTNVWAPISVDTQRGLIYLPVSTASNDHYGGLRPGQNLFAESLVCLDSVSGRVRWHQQLVHHGLWDYDLASQPLLATVLVDGRDRQIVAQPTKMGWVFVFDRVTGEPIWPLSEYRVPQSSLPGEQSWPTQPFPALPPPFSKQGITLDDAFDLTPEIRAEATALLSRYRLGPIFTPPSEKGTVIMPGVWGGANWGSAALDPSTGTLYVKSSDMASLVRVARIRPGDPRYRTGRLEYVQDGSRELTLANGLPATKPPYGHVTAIDLQTGTIAWRRVHGDFRLVREHPALAGIRLPKLLGSPGAAGLMVTAGGLVFVGGGDESLRAYDSATGVELWSVKLGVQTTGTPMTYMSSTGRQYILVAAGESSNSGLMAFSLPEGHPSLHTELEDPGHD